MQMCRGKQDISDIKTAKEKIFLKTETVKTEAMKEGMEMTENNSSTKIKICGLTRMEDISYVNEAKPDYVGFVIGVPKSVRNTTPEQVRALRKNLHPSIVPVGVFRDAPVELVTELLLDGTIGAAQLHGHEDEAYIRELKARTGKYCLRAVIIKAFNELTLAEAKRSSADLILLDHAAGGTGETFDWKLAGQIQRPFFLAGGIGPDNLKRAIEQVKPWGVDMSSRVETDGKKDREKILQAVETVRKKMR